MEAENNLIDNIHFRRIRKSTDHMSKYHQENQQCFYVVKMIISLSSYAYSPLFILMYSRNLLSEAFWEYITYPVVSIPSFYKNRKHVQKLSPASAFTFLSPYIIPSWNKFKKYRPQADLLFCPLMFIPSWSKFKKYRPLANSLFCPLMFIPSWNKFKKYRPLAGSVSTHF